MATTILAAMAIVHGAAYAFPTNSSNQSPTLPTNLLSDFPIKTGYVAFGDSYAAGLGTGTTTTDGCRVGSNNFADLLMRWVNKENIDYQRYVCSGDTTIGLDGQIAKWDRPYKADIATVSIGGNDLGFSDLVWYCILTPDPGDDNRKKCLEKQVAASVMLRKGLGTKLTRAYNKILQKSGRADFHLYVTGYPLFFDETDPDCDKTTFWYEGPAYNPWRWWLPYSGTAMLTTKLRAEMNTLVWNLNLIISKAVDRANAETRRDNVHFVEVSGRFAQGHRFCEKGDFHEPAPDRMDTHFFLSGWRDFPPEWGNNNEPQESDRRALIKAGRIMVPDAATCNNELGTDADPHARWMCRAAEAVSRNPQGYLATSLQKANAALAKGDVQNADINNWLPTSSVKTFHPRSAGMVAYRDAIINAIYHHQMTKLDVCHLNITEVWNCDDAGSNLRAALRLTDPANKVLYSYSPARPDPGIGINERDQWSFKKDMAAKPLTIVAKHEGDEIRFGYGGDVSWTSGDKTGPASCRLRDSDWSKNGPSGCSEVAVKWMRWQARHFVCQFPCRHWESDITVS